VVVGSGLWVGIRKADAMRRPLFFSAVHARRPDALSWYASRGKDYGVEGGRDRFAILCGARLKRNQLEYLTEKELELLLERAARISPMLTGLRRLVEKRRR